MARLTILAPFIGYLILYNQTLSAFLQLAVPLNGQAGVPRNFIEEVHLRRMDFFYFGLLLIGVGVGLFNIFAPSALKRYPDEIFFVEDRMKISTPLLVRNSVVSIVSRYLSATSAEQRSPYYNSSPLSFPDNIVRLLHNLIERLYRKADFMEDFLEDDGPPEGEARSYVKFETGSGYVDTSILMETMISGRRIDRMYWEALLSAAEEHPKEIYVLEYISGNFSRPVLRALCAFVLSLGFISILIPTATVSLIILGTWFA